MTTFSRFVILIVTSSDVFVKHCEKSPLNKPVRYYSHKNISSSDITINQNVLVYRLITKNDYLQ